MLLYNYFRRPGLKIYWTGLLVLLVSSFLLAQNGPKVNIHVDVSKIHSEIRGDVYVIITKNKVDPGELIWYNSKEYIFYTNAVADEYIYSMPVTNIKTDIITLRNDNTRFFPCPLNNIPTGDYYISAVFDVLDEKRDFAYSDGNVLSEIKNIHIIKGESSQIELTLQNEFNVTPFQESKTVKKVFLKSEMLSNFFGKETVQKAGVVLPPSYYSSPDKLYPVVYILPAFDRTFYDAMILTYYFTRYQDLEKIYVVLDPSCKYGNHVFANSDNNGPRGDALVNEFIPYIEKSYHILPNSQSRFLTGHSSGGWSALWLQLNYPDYFGGVWATSPDPVDFRSFQELNIYDSLTNAFYDQSGNAKLLQRMSTKKRRITYKQFSDFEKVVSGQQLASFEAVFSSNFNGSPSSLWDRETGVIDHTVAIEWQRYDLSMFLRKNFSSIGSGLQHKLHIFVGENDEFYLDKSVRLFDQTCSHLELVATINYIKDADHGSVLNKSTIDQIDKEINQSFRDNEIKIRR